MALAPRMINHTRFAFGAQQAVNSVCATQTAGGLKRIPHPDASGQLVDDLLRRSCLRCHLHTRGSERWGEHRGAGCSACHVPYPNRGEDGPAAHVLVRNLGPTPCLKCHNANHVGGDFVGLFEKDFHRGFRSPFVDGKQAPRIYGSEQHRLAEDLHFRAGMECMDCHTLAEVHGSGKSVKRETNQVSISCEGCHVRRDHPKVFVNEQGQALLLGSELRTIPSRSSEPIAHSVPEHAERVSCTACHAGWSFQDYGFHLMLEEVARYWKWAPTAAMNDPQVQALLERNVGTYVELIPPRGGPIPDRPYEEWEQPHMTDWLTGEDRVGAWFRGYTARRWSDPPLGVDGDGRVVVMRPMHQYVVSHKDQEGTLVKDREVPTMGDGRPALIFNPYAPHTISATGRNCHECHGNPKALGMGESLPQAGKQTFRPIWEPERKIPGREFRWDALTGMSGGVFQYSTHPGAGPLPQETIRRLLTPSPRQRALYFKSLGGDTGRLP